MTDKEQLEALELASAAESAGDADYPTAKKANAYYLCLLEDYVHMIRKQLAISTHIPGVQWQCGPQANGFTAPQADSQPAPAVGYPPLPRVGAIGYASVVDIDSYAKTLTIGPHLPGVRDIALWTTDQMRAYVDADRALRASHGQAPAAAPAQAIGPCVICGSDEPFTGTCGSGDPRALCKQPAPTPQADSVTAPAAGAVAHTISDAQIEAMPVWRNFVGLWPESRREIVDAVVDLLAAAPTPPTQTADSVLEDAARWQELREQHESDEALCCVFAPNDMRECLVPVGSLPGELDAFMDAERAARKQGGAT